MRGECSGGRTGSTAAFSALVMLVTALALGCETPGIASGPVAEAAQGYSRGDGRGPARPDRQIVRSGDLAVSVGSPEAALPEVERLVAQAGGLVEGSTAAESIIWLHCRVPAAELDRIMDAVAALGDEDRRSVSAADVTEEYVDLETRLRNDLALRDRLQQLLARAADVEDVLAIEKELNRIQSEIETRQAQLDRLELDVEMSALSITLQRERILGPLGYVGWGLWWAFSKLFVIR
jgi:hypothetical protein